MRANIEDSKVLCCRECMSQLNAECEQLRVQEGAQVEAVGSPLPSWLQKEKDKSEQVQICDFSVFYINSCGVYHALIC